MIKHLEQSIGECREMLRDSTLTPQWKNALADTVGLMSWMIESLKRGHVERISEQIWQAADRDEEKKTNES